METVKLTVVISKRQDKKLSKVAERGGRSKAGTIRILIDEAFKELSDRKADKV